MPQYVKVLHDYYCDTTREPSDDDGWDRGDTMTYHTVSGLVLCSGETYGDLLVDCDLEVGETYYLVYAVYSTGDSFGYDTNRSIEFIELYKSPDLASSLRENLEKSSETVIITTESQKAYRFSIPWNGYFESLGYVEVDSFILQAAEDQ